MVVASDMLSCSSLPMRDENMIKVYRTMTYFIYELQKEELKLSHDSSE